VTICDCARQVDPQDITGRDLEDVRPGGLGTHIMRTVMDEVEYAHRQPVGMQLRLLKMVANPADAVSANTRSAQEESPDGRR
jgi:anti-sigma regulatory factor (Ser/Thr protein kinase)